MNIELDSKSITLIAKTKKERHLWIGEFCRAIELGDSESPLKASRSVTPKYNSKL